MEDALPKNKKQDLNRIIYIAFLTILIAIIVYLSYFSALPIVRSIKTLSFQFQVDNVEGYLLDQALKLKEGKPIYTSINDYPYLVGIYAPIFPLINALFLFFFKPTFFYGRLINLISYLLISFFAGLMIYNHKKKIIASLLTIVLFLSSYSVYIWASYYRVDFLAILFGIIGIYLVSKNKLNLSILFFTLSFYTKQTNIVPLLATIIFLLIKDWKVGLKYILKFAIIILNIFIIQNLITHNEYAKNAIVYNINEFSFFDLKVWLGHYYFFYQYLIFLIISYAVYWAIQKLAPKCFYSGSIKLLSLNLPRNVFIRGLFLYFFISQLTLISTAKIGSAPNYLLEPILTLAIISGLITSQLLSFLRNRIPSKKLNSHSERSEESQTPFLKYIFITITIILLILHSYRITLHQRIQWANTTPDSSDNIKGKKILYILSSTNGEIITEYPIFAILSGKEVLFHPFIMTQLSKQNLWDQTKFVNDLKRKRFDFIITTTNILDEKIFIDNYTLEMLEAIRQNYSLYHLEPDVAGINYFILRTKGSL